MRELFKLFGTIGLNGAEFVEKKLTGIEKQINNVVRPLTKMSRQLNSFGTDLTKNVTVPVAAVGFAIYKTVESASNLSETVSKVGVMFGESSGEIDKWAGKAAQSIGQSKQQAMDAASTFGIFGRSAGLTGKELVNFSTKFTGLASDLASFNNTKPEDAITAIGAAMRGENEPMRRYGVLLDDASMRQKAFSMGIIDSVKNALTPQQKVLAASALIMEQTTKAQGDFARTSSGLANQQRILSAELANTSSDLGQSFLPMMLQVVKIFRDDLLPKIKNAIDWFNGLSTETKENIVKFGLLVAVMGPAIMVIGKVIGSVKLLVTAISTLRVVIASLATLGANPFVLIGTAIAALVVAGVLLYKNWDWVKTKMIGIWDAISYATAQAVSWIKEAFIRFGVSCINVYKEIAKYIPGLSKSAETAASKLEELIKKEEESRATRASARKETIKSQEAAEALAKANKELKTTIVAVDSATTTSAANSKRLTDEQIRKKAETEEKKLEFEKQSQDKVDEFQLTALQKLEKDYNENIALAEALGADKTNIEKKYAHDQAEIWDGINKDLADKDKALLQDLLETNQAKTDLAQQWAAKVQGLHAATYKEIKAQRAEDLKNAGDNQEAIAAINEFYDKILSDKRRADAEAYLSLTAATIDKISGLIQQNYQNKSAEIDNWQEREKASIETSTMNETQKKEAFEKLDIEADKKKKALRLKEAKAQKAASLFSAIVNTALGITSALGLPPPMSYILAALTGILGAAQIAVIAAQPLPMAKGAYVPHQAGGVSATIGEGAQDEIVFPLQTGVSMLADALFNKILTFAVPSSMPSISSISNNSTQNFNSDKRDIHLHIGTFIGDDASLKQLTRKISTIQISESQRKGNSDLSFAF